MVGVVARKELRELVRDGRFRWASGVVLALLAIALVWGAVAGRSLFYASPEAAAAGPDPLRDAGVGLLAGGIVILLSNEMTRRTAWGEALARALELPVIVTEQYPKGLGSTAAVVKEALADDAERHEKTCFSSCGSEGVQAELLARARRASSGDDSADVPSAFVRQALKVTMAGIASGLRNTG